MDLTQFRQQYPQYNHVDDSSLTEALYQKYYSHVDKNLFYDRFLPTPSGVNLEREKSLEQSFAGSGDAGTLIETSRNLGQRMADGVLGESGERFYQMPSRAEKADKLIKTLGRPVVEGLTGFVRGRLLGAPDLGWALLKRVLPEDQYNVVKDKSLDQAIDWAMGQDKTGVEKLVRGISEIGGGLKTLGKVIPGGKSVAGKIASGAGRFGGLAAVREGVSGASQTIDDEADYGYRGLGESVKKVGLDAILGGIFGGAGSIPGQSIKREIARRGLASGGMAGVTAASGGNMDEILQAAALPLVFGAADYVKGRKAFAKYQKDLGIRYKQSLNRATEFAKNNPGPTGHKVYDDMLRAFKGDNIALAKSLRQNGGRFVDGVLAAEKQAYLTKGAKAPYSYQDISNEFVNNVYKDAMRHTGKTGITGTRKQQTLLSGKTAQNAMLESPPQPERLTGKPQSRIAPRDRAAAMTPAEFVKDQPANARSLAEKENPSRKDFADVGLVKSSKSERNAFVGEIKSLLSGKKETQKKAKPLPQRKDFGLDSSDDVIENRRLRLIAYGQSLAEASQTPDGVKRSSWIADEIDRVEAEIDAIDNASQSIVGISSPKYIDKKLSQAGIDVSGYNTREGKIYAAYGYGDWYNKGMNSTVENIDALREEAAAGGEYALDALNAGIAEAGNVTGQISPITEKPVEPIAEEKLVEPKKEEPKPKPVEQNQKPEQSWEDVVDKESDPFSKGDILRGIANKKDVTTDDLSKILDKAEGLLGKANGHASDVARDVYDKKNASDKDKKRASDIMKKAGFQTPEEIQESIAEQENTLSQARAALKSGRGDKLRKSLLKSAVEGYDNNEKRIGDVEKALKRFNTVADRMSAEAEERGRDTEQRIQREADILAGKHSKKQLQNKLDKLEAERDKASQANADGLKDENAGKVAKSGRTLDSYFEEKQILEAAISKSSQTEPPAENGITALPTEDVLADPDEFQFKGDATGEGGISEKLKDVTEWNLKTAGVLLVWQRKDGKYFVVDGHHRLALAKRLSVPSLNTFIVRESDGTTAADARVMGAMSNLADGKGTAVDAAKIFRDSNITVEQLRENGVDTKGEVVKQGLAMKNLSDEVFRMVIDEKIPANMAAQIGEKVTDPVKQQAVAEIIAEGDVKTIREAEFLAQMVEDAPVQRKEQQTLFGKDVIEKSLYAEKAKVLSYIERLLKTNKKVFGTLSNKAGIIEGAGNKLNKEANLTAKDKAAEILYLIDKLARSKGPIAEELNNAAERYAENPTAGQLRTVGSELLDKWESELSVESVSQVRGTVSKSENRSQQKADAGRGKSRQEAIDRKRAKEAEAAKSEREKAVERNQTKEQTKSKPAPVQSKTDMFGQPIFGDTSGKTGEMFDVKDYETAPKDVDDQKKMFEDKPARQLDWHKPVTHIGTSKDAGYVKQDGTWFKVNKTDDSNTPVTDKESIKNLDNAIGEKLDENISDHAKDFLIDKKATAWMPEKMRDEYNNVEKAKKPAGGKPGASVAPYSAGTPDGPVRDYGHVKADSSGGSQKKKTRAARVEMPKSKKTLNPVKDIFKILSPSDVSKISKYGTLFLRKRLAEMAQKDVAAQATLEKAHQAFRKLSYEDMLEFIDDLENGRPQKYRELDAVAETFRELLDERRDAIIGLGKGLLSKFYENYFPHLWKHPDAVKEYLENRSLQGGKGFLKQRYHMTIKEGIDAGLELKHKNPVDVMLIKLHEMDKYLMAQNLLKDWKAEGIARFVSVEDQAPEGYKKIDDYLFTVFGPNTKTITEASDTHLVSQLLKFADSIGVKTERYTTIKKKGLPRGTLGFAEHGTDRVVTKGASPETTLMHEIGHQVGFKYNVYKTLTQKRKGVTKPISRGKNKGKMKFYPDKDALALRRKIVPQWRALADMRFEGMKASPAYEKYVRNEMEKEAVIFEAYINVPKKFKEIAPDLYREFDKFVRSKPELREIANIERSLVVGTNTMDVKIDGMVTKGHFMVPKDLAKVVSNYLSPGLRNSENKTFKATYRALRGLGNAMNQAQLSLSMFHGFNVTTDLLQTLTGEAMLKMMRQGHRAEGAKSLAMVLPDAAKSVWDGAKLKKAYRKPLDQITDPRMRTMVEMIIKGGGRGVMDSVYYNHANKALADSIEQLRKGTKAEMAKAAVKMPYQAVLAGLETISIPLMQWYIPSLKLGIYSKMVQNDMKRLEQGDINETQFWHQINRAWDSVENRMGQLTYDNLFWNGTLKDTSMLAVRSVGWNLGSWREFFGAVTDFANVKQRKEMGDSFISRKQAYAISAIVNYAIMGAVIQYALIGLLPDDWKDYFFPKTGNTNPDGSEERLSLPTYAKDIFGYAINTKSTAKHKLHPMWSLLGDLASNQDYFGTEIRDKNDPLSVQAQDMGKHIGKNFLPFTVNNFLRLEEISDDTKENFITAALGISPSPNYISRTKSQKLMYRYISEKYEGYTRTKEQSEKSTYKRDLLNKLRAGQPIDTAEAVQVLGREGYKRAYKQAKTDPYIYSFKQLSLRQMLNVYQVANKEEKSKVKNLVISRYKNKRSPRTDAERRMFNLLVLNRK